MTNSQDCVSSLIRKLWKCLSLEYLIEGEPPWAPVHLDSDFLVVCLASMPKQDVKREPATGVWEGLQGAFRFPNSIFQRLIMSSMHKFSLLLSLLKSNNDSPVSFQLNASFKESGVLAKHTLCCHPKQPLRMSSYIKIGASLFITRKQIPCLSMRVSPRVGYTVVPRDDIVLFPIFVTVWFVQMWYPNCLCKSCVLFSKSSWMLPILWISRQVKWQDWNDLAAWLASKLCFKF